MEGEEEFLVFTSFVICFHQLFLAKEEPLQASLPARANILLESLGESRKRYDTLLEEKLRAPDGNPRQRRLQEGDLDLNNPLSLHDEVYSPVTLASIYCAQL